MILGSAWSSLPLGDVLPVYCVDKTSRAPEVPRVIGLYAFHASPWACVRFFTWLGDIGGVLSRRALNIKCSDSSVISSEFFPPLCAVPDILPTGRL